jgi:hypothetical protein
MHRAECVVDVEDLLLAALLFRRPDRQEHGPRRLRLARRVLQMTDGR